MTKRKLVTRGRVVLLLLIAVVVPLGILTKRYSGPAQHWVRGNSGAVLYTLMLALSAQLVWIRARSLVLALAVLGFACVVELLQLYDAPWINAVRATFPGHMLLGSTGGFDVVDIVHYAIGSALAWPICARVRERPAASD